MCDEFCQIFSTFVKHNGKKSVWVEKNFLAKRACNLKKNEDTGDRDCKYDFFCIRLYVVFSYVEVQNCKHHNKKKTQKKNSHMKNISNCLEATQSLASEKSVERASRTCLCVCAQPIH